MTANSGQPQGPRSQFSRRRRTTNNAKDSSQSGSDHQGMPARSPKALTTSLESIAILPRTPRTPRSADQRWREGDGDTIDEVELSLLGEDERRQAAQGAEEDVRPPDTTQKPFSPKDKRAIALLVVLCQCTISDDLVGWLNTL